MKSADQWFNMRIYFDVAFIERIQRDAYNTAAREMKGTCLKITRKSGVMAGGMHRYQGNTC